MVIHTTDSGHLHFPDTSGGLLARVKGPPATQPDIEGDPSSDVNNDVVGRIRPAPDTFPIRGEGAQVKLINTTQGLIMRADHVVRDFLEDVHRELGEIVKNASGEAAPIGFLQQASPSLDVIRLQGLMNRAELFLENHSTARFDGLGPSLVVRNVASEGLKLFEHLRLSMGQVIHKGTVSPSERTPVLEQLVEMRGQLRGLVHHFDARMLEFAGALHQTMQQKNDGDGPHAA